MRVGDSVGDRYVLEEEVSGGGMSTVYRAWDLTGERTVAVKVIDDLGTDDLARFEREAALLAEVRHPGIVSYVDHGHTGAVPYLVMAWLEGQTLTQRLHLDGVSLAEAVDLVRRLCAALEPLHARGVVHRDVKPDNLVLAGGRIDGLTLIDLGLARRAWTSAPRVTASGIMVGTPGYMAPEQARGDRTIDPRADLFAVGCVLYECVTGYPAFAGENQVAVQSKILLGDPPPPETLVGALPTRLTELIARLLAKSRELRPRDVGEVTANLADVGALADAPRRRTAQASPDTLDLRARTTAPALPLRALLVARRRASTGARRTPVIHAQLDRRHRAVRAALIAHGASIEVLDADSLVATFAADLVLEHAADAAVAVLPLFPDATLALVAARGPIEELVDRAAARLEAAVKAETFAGGVPAIALDETTARALAGRFAVREHPDGWRLGTDSTR